MDFNFLRKNMVDCQLKPNKIINLNLIDAFLKVPREIFVNKKITTKGLSYNQGNNFFTSLMRWFKDSF